MPHPRQQGLIKQSWGWETRIALSQRNSTYATTPWRPAVVLDEWVQKEARPISLRQLTFFGRTLTENRLISSANYVRTELPTRLAHRLRDMQTLPFVVVTNPHMSHVYDLYYKAFEKLRRVREIKTTEENEQYCKIIGETLQEHLTVIPRLAMGVLECQELMRPDEIDKFMNTLLRSRISRRVIAEQHLALTETFNAPWYFPNASPQEDPNTELVGEVFLKCKAREVVEACWNRAISLAKEAYSPRCSLPDLRLEGHLEATFPYILSHLQYMVGELLRNSIQATVGRSSSSAESSPPIEVLICEAQQHVIIRVSDQGGGIPQEVMPKLWSFSKGTRSHTHLRNLSKVPKMAATMQELKLPGFEPGTSSPCADGINQGPSNGSLNSLTSRPPDLKLGMGLPMSRVYAEYWAGSLELHNLEGYGVDAFLQIPKLGNKNEQLSTRASMANPQETPTDRTSFAQRAKNESSKNFNHSVRRRLSQSHGDLSKLRPKSPPIHGRPAELCGLQLSPASFVDDTYKHFSPNYNNRSRQALPSNWTANWPVTQPNEAPRPTQQSSSEGSLPSTNASTGDARLGAIAIQGLSPGISGPLDFGKPVVRTYPNNDHDQSYTSRCLAVQHIDVKTEWNFSKYAEAQELCRIHQAFTITLERLLASELWKVYFQNCIPKVGEDARCFSAEVVRGISFCREQLVGDMADSLYSTQEDIRVRAQLGLIRLYLVASDCLIQYDGPHSRDTSITVRVHHDARSQTQYPFVQAAWVPDSIVFNDLDGTRLPREGQEFSFVPRYQCNSAFASTRFPTDVRYCIESPYKPLSWLTWDDYLAGFKGIVPIYSATPAGGYNRSLLAPKGWLCIDVKAVIVEDHGSSVHFERTVRARLTIEILPWDDTIGLSPCRSPGSDTTRNSFSAQRVECIQPTIDMSSLYTPSSSQAYDDRQFIFSSQHVSGPILSTAKSEVKTARICKSAQEHAYLTAKHAGMSHQLEDAEKRVQLLDSLGSYDSAQMQQQQPDFQGHLPAYRRSTPLGNYLDTGAPIVRDPFASSRLSRCDIGNKTSPHRAEPHQVAPRTPRLDGRAENQDLATESRSNARFPALPPPAVRSAPSQTFDYITQAWTRMYNPHITPTCLDRRSGSDTHQVNCILENRHTSRSLNDVLNTNYYRARFPAEEDRGLPGSADAAQNPEAPFGGTHEEVKNAKSERGSRKRYARSNLSNTSPSKSPRETESHSKMTTSGSDIASYNCNSCLHEDKNSPLDASGVQEASFLALPDSIGGSEGDASLPMRRGRRRLRTRTDSGYHLDVHNIESEAQPLQTLANPVQFVHGVPTPPDSLNNMSTTASDPEAGAGELKPWEFGYGQDRPTKMYTSHQPIIPRERPVCVYSWQTSSTFSHAASSNIELTVDDHDQIIDRREQAQVWHGLCENESSDQVDKPGVAEAETRLSEDEKKAIEEAIDRSLEDMSENFRGVFLNDSDELASGDETAATDEL